MSADFIAHVERHAVEAQNHLAEALEMLRSDPHPEVGIWLFTLGLRLQLAGDALQAAVKDAKEPVDLADFSMEGTS